MAEDPKTVKEWMDLAATRFIHRNYSEAIVCFERVLSINSMHARAWAGLGMTLRKLGNIDKAMVAYERAVGIDETDDIS